MHSNITEPACRKALDECDRGGFPGKGDRTTILVALCWKTFIASGNAACIPCPRDC
ncbi:MAG TPA: hypothetical protein V6D30_08055 [Leptolyngbyaceae cyanobacterium]